MLPRLQRRPLFLSLTEMIWAEIGCWSHIAIPQREDLSIFRQVLYKEFEQQSCFYCGKKLHEIHVDHFIPWIFIKEDKLWNFVLSCPSCNIKKSNKIPKMNFIIHIQIRNDELVRINSSFVQGQFKTYRQNLINDMWLYAKTGGFIEM